MFICTLKMTRQRKNRTTQINICSKLILVLCLSIQTQNFSTLYITILTRATLPSTNPPNTLGLREQFVTVSSYGNFIQL